MSAIGYRQKGQDGALYNPERDFAYITPTLMARAVSNMECAYDDSPEVKNWCVAAGIDKAAMAKVAEALALAQRDFVNAADPVSSFEHALRRRNFFDFPYELRQYLFAAIGETLSAAWFVAVREVSNIGEESPAQNNMARFSAIVNDFVGRVDCKMPDTAQLTESLRYRNDVLQTRLNVVYNELQATKEKLAAATAINSPIDFQSQSVEITQPAAATQWFRQLFNRIFRAAEKNKCRSTGCTRTRNCSGPS